MQYIAYYILQILLQIKTAESLEGEVPNKELRIAITAGAISVRRLSSCRFDLCSYDRLRTERKKEENFYIAVV